MSRPVWYPDDDCAVSYESVAEGQAIYGRGPDAWGLYLVESDGRLTHIFDTPCRIVGCGIPSRRLTARQGPNGYVTF